MRIQKRNISLTKGHMVPKLSKMLVFYGHYDRCLRKRKSANPSISLFPSLFVKKYILNVKEAVEMQRKAFACQK